MDRNDSALRASKKRGLTTTLIAGGLLAVGAAVGVVGVAAASAAPMLTAAVSTPSASSSGETGESGSGQRAGETLVTGAKAETLKAAALKAVPGATVERVETDADGAAYEVHLKKSDGSEVTVKFDSALQQTAIQSGHGSGGGHRGGTDHDADDSATQAG